MAKDTANTGKDSSGNEFDRTKNEVVKKGIAKSAARSDEKIIADSKLGKDDSRSAKNESIQAGNAARMKDLSPSNPAPKNPNVEPLDTSTRVLAPKGTAPDEIIDTLKKRKTSGKRNLTPKTPAPTDPNKKSEATTAARRRTFGRRETTGNVNFGDLPKRVQSPFDSPEATDNRIDRMQSGMGLPGSENGDLDLAIKLHARDLQTAKTTGKVVNGVNPTDSPRTSHNQIVSSQHHTGFARVMRVYGIADEEVYRNAASAAGMRLPSYVAGLRDTAQQHEDSKAAPINMNAEQHEHWEHPRTKEIIPVSANHPDMPSAFMRSKGVTTKVTMGSDGSEIKVAGHEGWTRMKTSDGKSLLRLTSAPTKGTDLVDHLRVQMLSEHGPSSTSRKKGASIANDIADVASGAVPRGMQKSGKRKVAGEGFGTEKYVDTYSPATRPPKERAFDKPKPPGVKGLTSRNSDRDTSAIQDGQYLLGSKPPADLPDFTAKGNVGKDGRRLVQDKLPGTGVPRTVSEEVTPAEVVRGKGPLEKRAYELDGTQVSKGTKFTLEDFYPKIETKPAVRTTRLEPTNRDWKPQVDENNPNRGQQFRVEMTSKPAAPGSVTDGSIQKDTKSVSWPEGPRVKMPAVSEPSLSITPVNPSTGLDDLRKIKAAGALVPSGKKTKKTKPMVQPSLFPDFSVKEGRKNAFDTAGSVVQASEATKQLQSDSRKRFGVKEEAMAVEGGYSDANGVKLKSEAPVQGSRAAKRAEAQSATDEITAKKLN
jgi:hypothetical protein